jgi:hypothetical protein
LLPFAIQTLSLSRSKAQWRSKAPCSVGSAGSDANSDANPGRRCPQLRLLRNAPIQRIHARFAGCGKRLLTLSLSETSGTGQPECDAHARHQRRNSISSDERRRAQLGLRECTVKTSSPNHRSSARAFFFSFFFFYARAISWAEGSKIEHEPHKSQPPRSHRFPSPTKPKRFGSSSAHARPSETPERVCVRDCAFALASLLFCRRTAAAPALLLHQHGNAELPSQLLKAKRARF